MTSYNAFLQYNNLMYNFIILLYFPENCSLNTIKLLLKVTSVQIAGSHGKTSWFSVAQLLQLESRYTVQIRYFVDRISKRSNTFLITWIAGNCF